MNSEWIEITAEGPLEAIEPASELLLGVGSGGLIEDRPEAIGNAPTARLVAYIPVADAHGVKGLKKAFKAIGWSIRERIYVDTDWAEKWKTGIRPLRVGAPGHARRFLIHAPWHRVRPATVDVVVEIEPGMAFGTGSHPTTRLCLKAMLAAHLAGEVSALLDVGTGSGILALGAKGLGIGRVDWCETDPEARAVAKENAQKNRARMGAVKADIADVRGRFDVVVANILSSVLTAMADALMAKTRPGGRLILSGILRDEAKEVRRQFEARGARFIKRYRASGGGGDWVALVFERPV